VGVWIGNLDQQVTDGVTGAGGPALILRSVFAELNRHQDTRPLYLSPRLVKAEVCRDSGLPADGNCAAVSEWFIPGTEPASDGARSNATEPVYLQYPTWNMQLAMDPRIPENQQAFVFKLANLPEKSTVEWYVDDRLTASTSTGDYLWHLQRGRHAVKVRFLPSGSGPSKETPTVSFMVK
jgi:penicillin-binding protein 1C